MEINALFTVQGDVRKYGGVRTPPGYVPGDPSWRPGICGNDEHV